MDIRTCAALALCVALAGLGPRRADAAQPELTAVLSVMGYGYKVKVTVNGADPGIEGGKSEGRRLFNKGSEMAKKASPQIRAKNFILNPGANEITVEYSKTDPKATDELEIKLEADGYPQPLFRLTNRSKPSDKVSATVMLAQKAPPDFRPVIVTEGK